MHADEVQTGANFDVVPMAVAGPLSYLLQHVDMNPHATMLGISRLTTLAASSEPTKEDLAMEGRHFDTPMGTKLDELAPPVSRENERSIDGTRRRWGIFMWRNWDKFSDQ